MTSPDRILDLTEVARMLGVSERTVRRWIAADGFPAFRARRGPGSRYRFRLRDVREWIERRREPASGLACGKRPC